MHEQPLGFRHLYEQLMQIDHDPNEFKNLRRAHFWGTVGFMTMIISINMFAHPVYDTNWRDWTALAVFVLLVSWLTVPSVGRSEDSESTGQRFAFRLGKALNQVLHYFSRNTARRNKAR